MRGHLVLCLLALITAIAGPCTASFSPALTFVTPNTSYRATCVDYDKDGYPDLILDGYVYHNNGNSTYSQVYTVPSVNTYTAWADFDNDGFRDVLVYGTFGVSDRVYRVTGYTNGVPTLGAYHDIIGWDVPYTNQTGTETLGPPSIITNSCAIADLNRDGKLDIYLGRSLAGVYPDEHYGKDWIVKNTTAGSSVSFLDITNVVQWTRDWQLCTDIDPTKQFRWTEGVGIADYNYDGYPDIFTATYRCKCNAFLKGAYGTPHGYGITNASAQNDTQSGTGLNLSNLDGDAQHGDGVYWFDYDNDGYLDLLEARLNHGSNGSALRFWHNNHDGTFTNVSNLLPQDLGQYHQHYRGIAVGDYDNDGDLDIYLTRSLQSDPAYVGRPKSTFPSYVRGRLLKNTLVENGAAGFTDAAATENLDNGNHANCFGTCFIDYDNDGKLDLFTMQGTETSDFLNELWRNNGSWTGHWLRVRVQPPAALSTTCNADGIGAIVEIWIDKNGNHQMDPGEILTRLQMGNTTGWLWQGPADLHFGLGGYTPSDHTIQGRVFWPGSLDANGNAVWQSFTIPGVDRLITTLPAGTGPGVPGIPTHAGAYSGSALTFNWTAPTDVGAGIFGYDCRITSGGTDVFNGAVGNVLSKTITGTNGTTYYCQVRAEDFGGVKSDWSFPSDGVTVDTIPPTGSLVINGGALYTNGTSTLLTLPATDSLSGVSQMRFSNNGTSWSSAEAYSPTRSRNVPSGDGLKTEYVQFIDAAGNISNSYSSTITVDQTLPTSGTAAAPSVVYSTPVSVTYSGASDATSGLKRVELWYKKGAGGVWTAASCAVQTGASGSFSFNDVAGSDTYFFGLVAEDNAGNRSSTPSGSGDTSTTVALPITIAQAKSADENGYVNTTGVISAVFTDCFYIEAGNRSCGIRIAPASLSLSPGTTVRVRGTISTLPTEERQLTADSVTDLLSPATIHPLGTPNKSLGGGAFGGQLGVAGGSGLNNVGLLVATTGRVSNASGTSFNMDDGSGVPLDAMLATGLTLPANGSYAHVIGVVSCEKDSGSSVQRVILVTAIVAY